MCSASQCARAPYVLMSVSVASASATRSRSTNWVFESFRPFMPSVPTRFTGAALTSQLIAPSTAILVRRESSHASDRPREVTRRPKANQPSDLSDRESRVAKQYRCPRDTVSQYRRRRVDAGALLEELRWMEWGRVCCGAEMRDQERCSRV